MEEKPKKKWYKTKTGIFFIILFFPISIFVFLVIAFIKAHKLIWKQNWKTPYRLAAIFGLWLLLFISPAFANHSEKLEPSTAIVTPQVSIEPTKQVTSIPVPTTVPTIVHKPTATAVPTYTPVPTRVYIAPTAVPATSVPVQSVQGNAPAGGSGFSCDCSLTCTEMTSCAEAQYELNTCGCSARDADHDGTACDGAPLHCQN